MKKKKTSIASPAKLCLTKKCGYEIQYSGLVVAFQWSIGKFYGHA